MIKRIPVIAIVLCLGMLTLSGTGVTGTQGQGQAMTIGVNYAPVQPGNATASEVSDAQIDQDLDIIAQKFTTLRIYQSQTVGEQIVRLAGVKNLNVVIQAWLDGDRANNEAEINSAISIANQYTNIVGVVVGSDVLSRRDLSVDGLIQAIQQVRAAVPAEIPVGYADAFLQWVQNPPLAMVVDWVGIDSYGFLDCQDTQGAVQYSINQWALLVSNPTFSDRKILLMETGWPSQGGNTNCPNQEVPTVAAQAQFTSALLNNVQAAQLDTFLFEFVDSPWRCAEDASARYRCHWGLVDTNRAPKDSWSALPTAVRAAPPANTIAVVESDNRGSVNCRVQGGLEQSVQTVIDNGEAVEILDQSSEEEWVKVRYGANECWIHYSLLLVDGRPLFPASLIVQINSSNLGQFIQEADPSLCTGDDPGVVTNQTWDAPDVVTVASCVSTLQAWIPEATEQDALLKSEGVCDTQPSGEEVAVQDRFQAIWALDNIAIAYYNLGRSLRTAGQFVLAQEAFNAITNNFSCAWAYDSSSAGDPFFWSIREAAEEQLSTLPLASTD